MYKILEGIPGQCGLFRVEVEGRPLLLVSLGERVILRSGAAPEESFIFQSWTQVQV